MQHTSHVIMRVCTPGTGFKVRAVVEVRMADGHEEGRKEGRKGRGGRRMMPISNTKIVL